LGKKQSHHTPAGAIKKDAASATEEKWVYLFTLAASVLRTMENCRNGGFVGGLSTVTVLTPEKGGKRSICTENSGAKQRKKPVQIDRLPVIKRKKSIDTR